MRDEDRLGWVKLFSVLSIVTAAGAYVFAFYYFFHNFSSEFDWSPRVGFALAVTGFLSGCVAVLLELKLGIEESVKGVGGILISLFYPVIFYFFKDFCFR